MKPLGTGRRALVVDDEIMICELLRELLEDEEFEVDTVLTVAAALESIGAHRFDLIMCDKNLPDGSGIDIARHCDEHDVPGQLIIMTAFANVQSARDALRHHVSAYIEKPFGDIDDVRAHVERAMNLHGLEEEKARLVSELVTKNQVLEALTVRDPLTRLYNHGYLQETVEREISRCSRNDASVSLLFLDLDRFKDINDTMGHVAGDRALKLISELISGEGRRTDMHFRLGPRDVAARYGGDEFALVLPETDKRGAAAKAERLREFVEGFDFVGRGLPHQTVSVGVASYPTDASDRVELIKAADAALYSAKRNGRNRIATYNVALATTRAQDDAQFEADAMRVEALHHSIASLDFDYVYQPIVSTSPGHAVFAYEALVRPRHKAFPHPGVLIETAERAGQIGPLGRALRQCSIRALDRLPADSLLFINLHPQELFDHEFASIESFVAQWAGQVVFEITEVAGIRDYTRVKQIINGLRGAGFKVALDDLGSGYSGLNSLAMLEPDFVKLDMSLVRSLPRDKRTQRLVRHIVEFSRDERMMVIAEGVETEDERAVVTDLGCNLIQGWLFGKGVPIEDIVG